MSAAESIAGRGDVRADLGNPICVVLDCDNTTVTEEDFGPAKRLGERYLWRLFDKDGHRYDAFKAHITSKAKMAEALSSTGRPVLILIDEIMDYIRVAAASDHGRGGVGHGVLTGAARCRKRRAELRSSGGDDRFRQGQHGDEPRRPEAPR